MDTFLELGIVIIIATLVAGVTRLFKQPLVISYIISGVLVGPAVFDLISSTETFKTFAHLGIALLLFTVGLNLNPKIIKEVGFVSLVTGLGQVVFTSVVGFFIAIALGFSSVTSIYIAIALTFSSTIIITKLLSDKGDMNSLYGKISIGFLLVQDIVVIFILMIASSITDGVEASSLVLSVLLKGASLFLIVFFAGMYIFPKLLKRVARSQEFLLLFALGWCFALAGLAYYLNFSIEIGALLAGVALAMSPYRYEISSKMIPLRDFFLVLFFIVLGSQIGLENISQFIVPIIVFSLFILVGNPIIVMIIMGILGYTKRNSFLAGLTVAQISEFSLIFVALGVSLGHVTEDVLSFITAVGIITIAGSTYLILYSDKIYNLISRYLVVFEKKGKKVDECKSVEGKFYDIILFGYDRIGYDVLHTFDELGYKYMVVDYNPDTIQRLTKRGIDCMYGDVGDYDLLNDIDFSNIKMAVSTIPKIDINTLLVGKIREVNKDAIITVVSYNSEDTLRLYDVGATYVLMPNLLGGYHVSSMIKKHGLDLGKFLKEKTDHIKNLKRRIKDDI